MSGAPPAKRVRVGAGGVGAAPPPTPYTEIGVGSPAEAARIKQEVLSLVFVDKSTGKVDHRMRRFQEQSLLPGPLAPVVTREDLRTYLAKDPYMVCEKSDGDRRMMYITKSRVVMIDRKFALRVPVNSAEVAAAVGVGDEEPILLDGELLQDRARNCIFMVFDIVACGKLGNAAGSMPLDKRICMMDELVVKKVTTARGAASPPPAMAIMLKEYLGAKDVGVVLDRIKQVEHKRWYSSPAAGRQPNLNDGVVFTPVNSTYFDLFTGKQGATAPLLKWKFLDEQTVDFLVRGSDIGRAAAGDASVVPLHVGLKHGQTQQIGVAAMPAASAKLCHLDKSAHEDGIIFECRYDLVHSRWAVCRPRYDKSTPNFITTAWSTLEAIAENISEWDLRAALDPPTTDIQVGKLITDLKAHDDKFARQLVSAHPGLSLPDARRHLLTARRAALGIPDPRTGKIPVAAPAAAAAGAGAAVSRPGSVRLAIIVPYRSQPEQNRQEQLGRFVVDMGAFLKTLAVEKYRVFVIEQSADGRKFNRGMLLNVGAKLAIKGGYNALCFHDVDLVPDQALKGFYEMSPERAPVHPGWSWKHYTYDTYVGGILTLSQAHFKLVNGYPNNFWGWGGEDDEIYARMQRAKLPERVKPGDHLAGRVVDLEDVIKAEKGGGMRAGAKLAEGGKMEFRNMRKKEARRESNATWRTNGLANLQFRQLGQPVQLRPEFPRFHKYTVQLIPDATDKYHDHTW